MQDKTIKDRLLRRVLLLASADRAFAARIKRDLAKLDAKPKRAGRPQRWNNPIRLVMLARFFFAYSADVRKRVGRVRESDAKILGRLRQDQDFCRLIGKNGRVPSAKTLQNHLPAAIRELTWHYVLKRDQLSGWAESLHISHPEIDRPFEK